MRPACTRLLILFYFLYFKGVYAPSNLFPPGRYALPQENESLINLRYDAAHFVSQPFFPPK